MSELQRPDTDSARAGENVAISTRIWEDLGDTHTARGRPKAGGAGLESEE